MNMRLILIILASFVLRVTYSQSKDNNYVDKIEKLRGENKLTVKTYPEKTFVGSLSGYYYNDALVLINSLTDAEAAGTETLYYIEHGVLRKVFAMAATFDSNKEWPEYFAKHKSEEKCYECHGKPNCVVTIITFDRNPVVSMTVNKRSRKLTKDEETSILKETVETKSELEKMLNEL